MEQRIDLVYSFVSSSTHSLTHSLCLSDTATVTALKEKYGNNELCQSLIRCTTTKMMATAVNVQ